MGEGATAITTHKTASDRPHYSMKQVRVLFATLRTSRRTNSGLWRQGQE